MSLAFPEVMEEIIDDVHDLDDVTSLCNLALTSHLFLPRSRYHLLSWHVCLNSIQRLRSFCKFFIAHPDRRFWVRSVTISRTKESPFFLDVIPMQLLANHPNLHQWKIIGHAKFLRKSPLLSTNSSKLQGLPHYARAITHLHLDGIKFRSCTDFVRYILAFPGLRHLYCGSLTFKREDDDTALVRARERLSKQSRLSHLTIGEFVPDHVVRLFLKSTRDTLQLLGFRISDCDDGLQSDDKLSILIPSLSNLSSITLEVEIYHHGLFWRDSIVLRTFEVLQALVSNPNSCITEITIHLLDRDISKLLEYLRNNSDALLQVCSTLETALLRLPRLPKIEFCHYLRRPLRSWMPTKLELAQYFPTLCKRGLIVARCLAPPFQCHSDEVRALAVSFDGRWIASGSSDSTIILWDALRTTIVHEWPAYSGEVTLLTFSKDGRYLASTGSDQIVKVWDVSEEAETRLVTTLDSTYRCIWQPDGMMLALRGRWKATVHVWSPSTNRVKLHPLENSHLDTSAFSTAILSADGCWIAIRFDDSTTSWWVWNARTGRRHDVLCRGGNACCNTSIAFDPACRRIVIPSRYDYSTHICDVETGDELTVLAGHTSDPGFQNFTTFSPDGTRVLSTGSEDGMIRLWDSFTGDILLSFQGHERTVSQARFSPDGKYVASASEDHTVKLWNTSDGLCIRTFTEVECAEFTPDGETLAFGGTDGKVYIRRLRDVSRLFPEDAREIRSY